MIRMGLARLRRAIKDLPLPVRGSLSSCNATLLRALRRRLNGRPGVPRDPNNFDRRKPADQCPEWASRT
jgi:hypothetical protein